MATLVAAVVILVATVVELVAAFVGFAEVLLQLVTALL
jgi:hypothetical protein